MKYRPEIDGLRAVAVVPVVLFHLGVSSLSGGYVGVDVFFVISGYLITLILLEEIKHKQFSILSFYERRARRILPALTFMMLCCVPFAWMLMLPGELYSFAKSFVAVSLFSSNVLFWLESGYFAELAEEKPLLHTWSLSVEEQFYLVFPIFLLLLWRIGPRRLFATMMAVALISLVVSEWGWRHEPSANFYLAPSRAWELLAGAMAALFAYQRGLRPNGALASFGLLMILGSIFLFDTETPFPSFYTVIPVFGATLIILFGSTDSFTGRLLASKPMVGIGLVSYSVYLWHQPLLAFARLKLGHISSIEVMFLLGSLSFLFGYLSWRYVERPFRSKSGLLKTRNAVFISSFATLFLVISVGVFGAYNKGFESRFERGFEGDVNHHQFLTYLEANFQRCEDDEILANAETWQGFTRCRQSGAGLPNLVLLGDSHAEHLFIGLADALADFNVGYYIMSGVPGRDNRQFQPIFDAIERSEEPLTILLTMHYLIRVDNSDQLYQMFESTVNWLVERGHNVVLVGDVPRYKIEPQDCVFGGKERANTSVCSMPKTEGLAQLAPYQDTLLALRTATGVGYYSLDASLCNDERCSMVDGDQILYRDSNHLNILGSKKVGAYLAEKIKQDARLASLN